MILVILGIFVVIFVVGWFSYCHDWDMAETMPGVGFFGAVISFIIAIVLAVYVSGSFVIDEKIAMYQEENAKIEEQIAAVVEQYQQYETDIFQSVAPESAVTLVAMYPELKSDTLVQTQIEVYMANNETIKQLRTEKIDASVLRWWLYFGG